MRVFERGPAEIGLVIYPGVQLAAVHGLTDLFAIANNLAEERQEAAPPVLRVTHWQPDAGGAVTCVYDTLPTAPPKPEFVLIPLTLAKLPPPYAAGRLVEWVRAQHSAGAIIGSICSGAFLLAQTGLPAGRPVATHWSCTASLKARFPDVSIETGSRMIDHGDIITAGGFLAWVDLGLRLVARLLGPTVATDTERFLSVSPDAAGSRYLGGFAPHLTHGDAAVLRAQHWLHGRDARHVSLAVMASKAGLEKRTFLRRFARATGLTPLEYCRNVRMTRARELLEHSGKTLKVVAWEVGYNDPGTFARAFERATGFSPGAYRRRFGIAREIAFVERRGRPRQSRSRAEVG